LQLCSYVDGISTAQLARFNVVVFTGALHRLDLLVEYNAFCRSQPTPIGFVCGLGYGAFGMAFSDFGPAHDVFDKTGDPPAIRAVVNITNAESGIVELDPEGLTVQSISHDFIELTGVQGMDAKGDSINRAWRILGRVEVPVVERQVVPSSALPAWPPNGQYRWSGKNVMLEEHKSSHIITTVGRKTTAGHKLLIGDTRGLGEYKSGGTLTSRCEPVTVKHESLATCLRSPNLVTADFSKLGRPLQLHLAMMAIAKFLAARGRLPGLQDEATLVALAEVELKEQKESESAVVDADVIRLSARFAGVELQPLGAFFGGVLAQEAMKWTGKFEPLSQMLHVDMFELLDATPPSDLVPLPTAEIPGASRYAHLLAMFGERFVSNLQNKTTFMVGCGALGCEYLKNFAMLGLGCGPEGRIYITDDDVIEVSNLSRQFLFREDNVGQLKAVAATAAVQRMNSAINVTTFNKKVMPSTEDVFNDQFWESLDFVTNALDNVQARKYVDGKCVFYEKPLLESGTQGTMFNGMVVLPHITKSYNDDLTGGDEAPGEGIPMCTLRFFPNLITHCVEWARAMFTDLFEAPFVQAQKLVSNPTEYLAALRQEVAACTSDADRKKKMQVLGERLEQTLAVVSRAQTATFASCVVEARALLLSMHRDNIMDIVHQNPEHKLDKTGRPFWSASKRFPRALAWGAWAEPEHPNLPGAFLVAVRLVLLSFLSHSCFTIALLVDFSETNRTMEGRRVFYC
jgi:ubiquitin-activating enzyme E1